MNHVKLVNTKLSVEEISEIVSSPRCGAISLFIGTTRDNFQDQIVLQLEYEAYEPMAIKALSDICGEIRTKWPSVENIAIYHRLGIVPVKEASVVIAVSSPHRLESLEAVSHTIEALKASVPIWKKEVYGSDKPAQWKENKELISNLSKKFKMAIDGPLDKSHTHTTDPEPLGKIGFTPINMDLVQIKADTEEIERRIRCFIERKREDVNAINNRDFCNHSLDPGEESRNSCARVDALLVRRTDSNSHLRIRRVCNKWGPQTRENDSERLMEPDTEAGSATSSVEAKAKEVVQFASIEERLRNAEQHLKPNGPVPKDVYARLKRIESRILFLEGSSPEYAPLLDNQTTLDPQHCIKFTPKTKKIYTLHELENKIHEYQSKIVPVPKSDAKSDK